MTFPAHQHRRPAVAPAGARASGGAAARAGFPPPAPEATLDSSRPGGRREPSTAFCPPTPSRRGRQAWASFRLLLVYFLRGRQGGGPDLPVVRDRLQARNKGQRTFTFLRSVNVRCPRAVPFQRELRRGIARLAAPSHIVGLLALGQQSPRNDTERLHRPRSSYPTRRLRLRLFSPTVMAESRGSLDEQGGGGIAHRRGVMGSTIGGDDPLHDLPDDRKREAGRSASARRRGRSIPTTPKGEIKRATGPTKSRGGSLNALTSRVEVGT